MGTDIFKGELHESESTLYEENTRVITLKKNRKNVHRR